MGRDIVFVSIVAANGSIKAHLQSACWCTIYKEDQNLNKRSSAVKLVENCALMRLMRLQRFGHLAILAMQSCSRVVVVVHSSAAAVLFRRLHEERGFVPSPFLLRHGRRD